MKNRLIALLACAALLISGCGGDTGGAGPIILTPAAAAGLTGEATVQGFLWAVGGSAGNDVRLCETILESYPPQCGEPSIPVDDLALEKIAGLQREGTVAWAEQVRLAGVIVAGMLQVERVDLNVSGPSTGLALRALVPAVVEPGEVAWTLLVTNGGQEPVTLTYPTGQDADLALLDGSGAVAYRWSEGMAFTQAVREATLQPGSGRRIVLEGALAVPPATYTLIVTLAADPSPGEATGQIIVG